MNNNENKFAFYIPFLLCLFILIISRIISFAYPFFLSGRSGHELYINWNIILPRCKNVREVFRFDYREGQDFVIYEFNDRSVVIDSLKMMKITVDNNEEVKNIIDDYYGNLHGDEKDKFDNEILLDNLYSYDNYYLYLEDEDDKRNYVILILCPNNKLYELHNVDQHNVFVIAIIVVVCAAGYAVAPALKGLGASIPAVKGFIDFVGPVLCPVG